MYPQQQPQFPPAPQGYPAQQPTYPPPPAYPPQAPPGYPPPAAYPQAPPGYPQAPQGYPQAPPPVAAPMPGTLDDFYAQPSTGGGKSLAFEHPGTQYIGIVTRPISNADIEQQTNPSTKEPAFFKDGRPKYVMRVPLQMQPSAAYPDGLAQWYCRGSARDELIRAMAEVGAPEGPPEAGAIITITMTGTRPAGAGMSPAKLFQVQYRRPQGAQPAAPVAAPAPPPPTPAGYHAEPPPTYAANNPTATYPANDATTNGQHNPMAPTRVNGAEPPAYVPPTVAYAPPPAAPAPMPPPPPVAAAPAELSAEQRALLAQLTGQPA